MNPDVDPLSAPAVAPAIARPGTRPVLGFFLDVVIAAVALLLISVGCMVVWGVFQGIQAGMQGVAPADAAAAIGQPGAIALIWTALVGTGGAALIVYFWRRRAHADERRRSWLAARQPSTWGWVLLVAIAATAFSSGAQWLAAQVDVEAVPTNLGLVKTGFTQHPWFLLVFAVVLAPAYEELLFRRVLFGRLWAAGRPWLGLVLSSMVFALMHEIPGVTGNTLLATGLLWLVYGGMGAAFAWLYWRTGTLWAPIAAHALNNLSAITLLALGVG